MLRKTLIALLAVFLVASIFLALAPVDISAATCTSGDGKKTCTGPCCWAGPDWCKAGQCEN